MQTEIYNGLREFIDLDIVFKVTEEEFGSFISFGYVMAPVLVSYDRIRLEQMGPEGNEFRFPGLISFMNGCQLEKH